MSKPTNTKEHIISEAKLLFAKHGYDGTSMSELAAKVGIKKSSLYYFVKDKESLWKEVVHSIWGKLTEEIAGLSEEDRKDYPTEQKFFAAILYKVIQVNLTAGLAGTMEEAKAKNPAICREILKHSRRMRKLLYDYLVQQNISRPHHVEELVANALHGYVIHSQYIKPRLSPKEFADYISLLFINH